jgi:hypothetical protein
MRVRARSIAAVLCVTLAAALPASVQATTPIGIAAKVCHSGTPARIGGAEKCLQAGEYCAIRYERQYEYYGYECSASYHPPRLRRRR